MSDTHSTNTVRMNPAFTVAPMERYFPAGSLGETAELSELRENSYSAHLQAFGEPSLFMHRPEGSKESYRFLWLRTFHPPLSIRVEASSDSVGILVKKIGSGAAGFGPSKPIRERALDLPKKKAGQFLAQVNFYKFWELPTLESGLALDGASWILEGVKNGRYHIVDRHSPKDGPVRKLGLTMMIDLAKLRLLYQDVY